MLDPATESQIPAYSVISATALGRRVVTLALGALPHATRHLCFQDLLLGQGTAAQLQRAQLQPRRGRWQQPQAAEEVDGQRLFQGPVAGDVEGRFAVEVRGDEALLRQTAGGAPRELRNSHAQAPAAPPRIRGSIAQALPPAASCKDPS